MRKFFTARYEQLNFLVFIISVFCNKSIGEKSYAIHWNKELLFPFGIFAICHLVAVRCLLYMIFFIILGLSKFEVGSFQKRKFDVGSNLWIVLWTLITLALCGTIIGWRSHCYSSMGWMVGSGTQRWLESTGSIAALAPWREVQIQWKCCMGIRPKHVWKTLWLS